MNSFAKYPDIATLWSDQNELTADEVRPNHRSGAWTCPTCHNDYNAEIIDMVNGNADCPYCIVQVEKLSLVKHPSRHFIPI